MARGPASTSSSGDLITGHISGNLEYAHSYTNITAPPICIAFDSDALHKCLYNQANAPLPQLYLFALLIGFRNCRGITDTRSADLSINKIVPNRLSMR